MTRTISANHSFTIIVATRNRHKLAEIQAILGAEARCLDLDSLPGAPVSVENSPEFAGNALIKAMDLARYLTSKPNLYQSLAESGPVFILADDSGLEVDALGGAPGVHSARYAAMESGATGNATDEANRAKLLRALQGVPVERRAARFRCAIALVMPGLHLKETFEGACEGRIGLEPRGSNGFGYDPLFIPTGLEQTFGELGEGIKNGISHRSKALEKLKRHLTPDQYKTRTR
jgi:XTP/dITP diphosphohydrolase